MCVWRESKRRSSPTWPNRRFWPDDFSKENLLWDLCLYFTSHNDTCVHAIPRRLFLKAQGPSQEKFQWDSQHIRSVLRSGADSHKTKENYEICEARRWTNDAGYGMLQYVLWSTDSVCRWHEDRQNKTNLMRPALTWRRIIRWCLYDNAAATVLWAGVNSDNFLGRAQVTMVQCMAQKLLQCRRGVLARVYVHVLYWLWHVINRCPGHQRMQVCTLHRFDISVCICNTIAAGCTHALVYVNSQVVHSRWGTRVGGPATLVAWQGGLSLTEGAIGWWLLLLL